MGNKKSITGNKQKELEKHHLLRFKSIYSDFPSGKIICYEKPDFIIENPQHKIGIELTEIYKPGPNDVTSPQAQENLRQRVLDEAKLHFDKHNGSSYFVNVHFALNRNLQHNDIQALGKKLAEFVIPIKINSGEQYSISRDISNYSEFPKGFHRISIYHEKTTNTSKWVFIDAGFVPDIPSSRIKDILLKKESKIDFSKDYFKELWLLIIAYDIRISANLELCEESKTETYLSKFDKVFFLWSSSKSYFQFNIKKIID
jgi:hypothetical protein